MNCKIEGERQDRADMQMKNWILQLLETFHYKIEVFGRTQKADNDFHVLAHTLLCFQNNTLMRAKERNVFGKVWAFNKAKPIHTSVTTTLTIFPSKGRWLVSDMWMEVIRDCFMQMLVDNQMGDYCIQYIVDSIEFLFQISSLRSVNIIWILLKQWLSNHYLSDFSLKIICNIWTCKILNPD